MNKLADARYVQALAKKTGDMSSCEEPSVISGLFRRSLFLEITKEFFFEEEAIYPTRFSAHLQNFMEARRNITRWHFVYTGAAPYRAAKGEIQKKPRGGSRGAMTRSFSGR